MKYASRKKVLLVFMLAMGLSSGGCAVHQQRGTQSQYNGATTSIPPQQETVTPKESPHSDASRYNSQVTLNPQPPTPSVAPWLQFPVTTGLDESLSDLWITAEDNLPLDNGAGDAAASTSSEETDKDASDLWDRIRQGFDLPDQQNARIEKEAEWFGRHQAYLDRVAVRAQPYLHYIVDQVQQRGMPSEIALLPVVESAFQPYAYSSGRAAGIWQFIPDTGRRYGLKLNWWYDGRRDIVASTQAALDYFQYLHDTFDGDWLLALAAYNSGEGTVLKAIRANQRRGKPTDFWSLRLPRETEDYVPRLLALREIVADPGQQGISLMSIANEPYLTSVKIDSQLDLATAAKLAGMNLEELHQLNPGFNRWATAPDGPHSLLLPLDKAALFVTNIEELSPQDRVHWVRHQVRRGETLNHIAVHYKTTGQILSQFNMLKGQRIRPGQYIVVPITSNAIAADKTDTSQELTDAAEKTMHKVAAGETLLRLSHRYGVTVRQLSIWNDLKPDESLRSGRQLIVGVATAPNDATPNLYTLATAEEIAKPRKITYKVRKGDSLMRISQRFSVSIRQVKKWNAFKKHQRIQLGQELTLYVALTADSERG